MVSLRIECLGCGQVRLAWPETQRRLDGGACPRCGYVGWAQSSQMNEGLRRMLRERPPERRRLRIA
jgi:DNA-directed RNA polymerase subunit RPC12/RpoP